MNFRKWRNAVAIFQPDSPLVRDLHLSNRGSQSDKTNMQDGAFWAKVFPTSHFKPFLPELLADLEPKQVMPIAESVHDFHLSRLQCSQSSGTGTPFTRNTRNSAAVFPALAATLVGDSGSTCSGGEELVRNRNSDECENQSENHGY